MQTSHKRTNMITLCLKQVLVPQLCPTLCNPVNYSLPGSSVHRILQQDYWSEYLFPSPRDLPNPGIEPRSPVFQAISLLSESLGKPLLVMSNSVTPQIVAHQAPLPMEFSRQEYWSGEPFPSPGNLPFSRGYINSGFEPRFPVL